MAKLRHWVKGLKEGNRPVGISETSTLKHIKYQPNVDQVVATRPITTTLNSLFLGGQHKMSSGGENIFFNNLTTNTRWYPMWGGLKNQELPENQDASGFIHPSARIYSDSLVSAEFTGPESIPFRWIMSGSTNPAPFNVSVHGVTLRPRDPLLSGTKMKYVIRDVNEEGIDIYNQILFLPEGLPAEVEFNWWFDHPVEVKEGVSTFAQIQKEISPNTDIFEPLYISGSQINPDQTYSRLFFRSFGDSDITLKEDLLQTEWALANLHDDNTLHFEDLSMFITELGIPILFQLVSQTEALTDIITRLEILEAP